MNVETLLPHAYAIELVQFFLAHLSLALSLWMSYETGQQHRFAIRYMAPMGWQWQSFGNFTAELLRVVVNVQLVGIGWFSITHSAIGQPVDFWNVEENLHPWRILATTVTVSKMMAALTARWCRWKSTQADDADHVGRVYP